MRNILLILMLFITGFASGQEATPIGTVAISPLFKYDAVKKTIWVYKGVTYLWSEYLSAKQVKNTVDSIMNTVYNKHYIDSLMGLKQNVLINPVVRADSTTVFVTPYQLSQNHQLYEYRLTTGITNYTIPFALKPKALVWYNGTILEGNQYSGSGNTITLYFDIKNNDVLKIQN